MFKRIFSAIGDSTKCIVGAEKRCLFEFVFFCFLRLFVSLLLFLRMSLSMGYEFKVSYLDTLVLEEFKAPSKLGRGLGRFDLAAFSEVEEEGTLFSSVVAAAATGVLSL